MLGRGSFGIVFKALYRGKMVAVKIISKCDGYKFSSINRERNLLHLSNQNIIKILKIVDSKDYGAIIMERFESSRNLQFILDHCNKIDLIHRLKIMRDIASALKFCHRNNIIHRDLKPNNLMIILDYDRNDFICKLFDFGCSCKISNNSSFNQYEMLKNGHEEYDFNDSIVVCDFQLLDLFSFNHVINNSRELFDIVHLNYYKELFQRPQLMSILWEF